VNTLVQLALRLLPVLVRFVPLKPGPKVERLERKTPPAPQRPASNDQE
jgi:hypothetical protein